MSEAIKEAMAKAVHACAWADAAEEAGVSLSGCEIMDVMDPVTDDAREWAADLFTTINSLNGGTLDRRCEELGDDGDRFGHYLAMEALGHGVAWDDDGDEPHGLTIPYREGLLYGPAEVSR